MVVQVRVRVVDMFHVFLFRHGLVKTRNGGTVMIARESPLMPS
eukprot:CCRYP_005856-RG/>CCRYP_005856-RG protein AED:0.47 eAED:0.47 QI:0/-1/0/1/-1/0/1/0/42